MNETSNESLIWLAFLSGERFHKKLKTPQTDSRALRPAPLQRGRSASEPFNAFVPGRGKELKGKYLRPDALVFDVMGTTKVPNNARHLACKVQRQHLRQVVSMLICMFADDWRVVISDKSE